MTIENAAQQLQRRFQEAPWLNAVGVGQYDGSPCIFLYVKSVRAARRALSVNEWRKFPIVIRKMGALRPAASTLLKAVG
jgi:hypothetical protein